ncbi:SDR family NAD(P)-dependent oxidoreductase [Streptomyces sp. NPDC048161]|uniref:SDR family NAD(P)-dependent oxidoreductase n=1 Tax=unclassified Streptomyces TaxID=2593676 RepID=UPI0033D186EA
MTENHRDPAHVPTAPLAPGTTKVVLVTGATSGNGRATARRPARDGHHAVLTGRRSDLLERTAEQLIEEGHRAGARYLDVTDRAGFADLAAYAIAYAISRPGDVDVDDVVVRPAAQR